MHIHVVGYPHTDVSAEYGLCGFSQKQKRFCRMMKLAGHRVTLYGGIKTDAECDEFVPLVNEQEQVTVREWKHYIQPSWNPRHWVWVAFNERAARAIKERAKPNDPVFVLGGTIFKLLESLLPDQKVIENGIGYFGYALKHLIWESQAWKDLMFLSDKPLKPAKDDPIIWSFWDHNDFQQGTNLGYLLYLGRVTETKGVEDACEAAKRSGRPLKVIGHGNKKLVTYGEYLGEVSLARRNELIAGADAVICPARAPEAFGNIVPEAGFCGTRVISSKSGAFKETVVHGMTGWRCNGVDELVEGIQRLPLLADRNTIRKLTIDRFGLNAAYPKYEAYLKRIGCLC
jgi:glycosyltransferase involved in cell wall biosynthesis